MRGKAFNHLLVGAAAIAIGLTTSTSVFAQAFSGTYTFGSSGSTSSFAYNGSVIANLTVSNFTQSGVLPSSSSGNFRASNWALDNLPVGGLTGVIDTSKYFQFTLTASPGYTFNLTDLNFGFGRSGTGPRQIQWRSSLDSYAAPIPFYSSLGTGTSIFTTSGGTLTIQDTTTAGLNVVLALSGSSASYTNLNSIGFRFYAYNSEGSAGTGGLQGPFAFSGVLTAPVLADLFWNGGSWGMTGPGVGGSGAWADGSGSWDSARVGNFGGSAGTVTSDAVTAASGMVFATSGYTVTGGTITLAGSTPSLNAIVTGSTTPFTTTIYSVLAGSAGLTKSGAGTLVLGGANAFSGNLAVNAGTLEVAAESALGAAANDVSLASATLKTTASMALGAGRDVTGGGTLDIAPGTTLTSSGSFNLTSTTLANGGTLDLQGSTRSVGALTFGTAATVNGAGAISVSSLSATAVTTGSAIVNPAITFSSAGDKTVDVGSGGTLALNGDIAGTTGRIAKTGLGTLIVSGSNFTSGYRLGAAGATPTIGGTLILAAAAASGTGQLQCNFGTLQATAPFTFANGLSIGGRAGAVAVLGGTNAMTFSGSTSFFRGTATSGELRFDVNNATTLAGLIGSTSGGGSATGITIGGTGSLAIDGSASALTEAITLQDSLTLLVGGTLGSSVTVGLTNAIGGGGTLLGSLSLTSGADFIFDASKTLTVNGASVSFGGFGVSDLLGFSALVPDGTYSLIGGFAVINTANLNNVGAGNAFDLGGGRSAYFDTSSGLSLMVVPEPGSLALAGLGVVAASMLRRRRTAA